jgi:hypothetical protein
LREKENQKKKNNGLRMKGNDFFNPKKYFLNMDSSIVIFKKRKLSLGERIKDLLYDEPEKNLRRKSSHGVTHGFLTSLE